MPPILTRRSLSSLGIITVVVVAITSSARALSPGETTRNKTIIGNKAPFASLRFGPGEKYTVRAGEFGAAHSKRAKRRRSLIYFSQLTDFQLVDEESPARAESLDDLGRAYTGAWRPQEALLPFFIDSSVRQLNTLTESRIAQGNGKRAKMALAVLTGDNIDNQQQNEAEWALRLIEGGQITPGSGSTNPADYQNCPSGTPGPATATQYHGVQNYSGPAKWPLFYNPDNPTGRYRNWPRYPGLLNRAQETFNASGLRVKSYAVLGNHDSLVQGNVAATLLFNTFAIGCVKPLMLPFLTPKANPTKLYNELAANPASSMLVPPDPRRQFISTSEYREVFSSGSQRDKHGFAFVDPKEMSASHGAAAYYAWDPKPGLRFIVLNTVSEGGALGLSVNGNLDNPQFQWLKRELKRASDNDKLIVLFSHHAPEDMDSNVPDERAPKCTTPPGTRDPNPGCKRDPRRSTPIHLGKDVVKLLHSYPHVVAWVAGHTHANIIHAHKERPGRGFWGIRTSAIADWPQQNRLIEIMDNHDGTLSLFATMVHDSSPLQIPPSGTPASSMGIDQLASIAKAFAYNDPQAERVFRTGTPSDRNVELLVTDPRRAPGVAGTHASSVRRRMRIALRSYRQAASRKQTRGKQFGRRNLRAQLQITAGGRPVRGALVVVGNKRMRTGRHGEVLIVLSRKQRTIRAHVSARGLPKLTKTLKVSKL